MKTNKKGALGDIMGIVLGIVGIVVVLVMGFKITDVLLGTTTSGSYAYNATESLQGDSGLGLVTDLVPVIVIILVFAGVFAYFKFFGA